DGFGAEDGGWRTVSERLEAFGSRSQGIGVNLCDLDPKGDRPSRTDFHPPPSGSPPRTLLSTLDPKSCKPSGVHPPSSILHPPSSVHRPPPDTPTELIQKTEFQPSKTMFLTGTGQAV